MALAWGGSPQLVLVLQVAASLHPHSRRDRADSGDTEIKGGQQPRTNQPANKPYLDDDLKQDGIIS